MTQLQLFAVIWTLFYLIPYRSKTSFGDIKKSMSEIVDAKSTGVTLVLTFGFFAFKLAVSWIAAGAMLPYLHRYLSL